MDYKILLFTNLSTQPPERRENSGEWNVVARLYRFNIAMSCALRAMDIKDVESGNRSRVTIEVVKNHCVEVADRFPIPLTGRQ